MADLKPCPFCGGAASLVKKASGYSTNPTTIEDKWQIKCDADCCRTQLFTDRISRLAHGELVVIVDGVAAATAAWNRRAEQ